MICQMTHQLSICIVMFFLFVIGLCLIILFFALPRVLESYRSYKTEYSYHNHLRQSLSKHLEEISLCINNKRIKNLVHTLRIEAMNITRSNLHTKSNKNPKYILIWLNNFSISKHIEDIKKFGYSTQIIFDRGSKNFKLNTPK